MNSKTYIIIGISLLYAVVILFFSRFRTSPSSTLHPIQSPKPVWSVRSIDTMKYSRDLARQKAKDPTFDAVINEQIKAIANTGASHVAIATPYDPEFIPFLTRWVKVARSYKLKVWFRGNVAGWEQWFDYPLVSRTEHINIMTDFIKNNSGLFAEGDIFTPCPECENGGTGDPRKNGDIASYRQFLIDEYNSASSAFSTIGKNVSVGYFSMNYDVAKLIMNPDTTSQLGGIVAIDHYVATPTQLATDIRDIAKSSGGKVYLAEWGAPIPDIHGNMSETEQSAWIRSAFEEFLKIPSLVGLNYWVSVGGSTELWDDPKIDTEPASAVRAYYSRLENLP